MVVGLLFLPATDGDDVAEVGADPLQDLAAQVDLPLVETVQRILKSDI